MTLHALAPTSSPTLALTAALLLSATLGAETIRFPADAGVVDVTAPPYGADATGATDVTAVLQRALNDHPSRNAIIFLPRGTYLISDTLHWPAGTSEGGRAKRVILQGEDRDGTILRLRDACPGFTVAPPADEHGRPVGKAMIDTGTAPAQRFRNAVHNLTIDVGTGNPGAIGLRFNTSNQGGVFEVSLRAGIDSGAIGLDLGYTGEIGPLLVRGLRVDGFAVGVHSWGAVNSITMVDTTLHAQRVVGIRNDHQVLNIENLRSVDCPLVLDNVSGDGVVSLIGAELTAPEGTTGPALRNRGLLTVRDLRCPGFATAILNRVGDGSETAGPEVAWFTSHPPTPDPFAPERAPEPLRLPIQSVPVIPWGDHAGWANPVTFGAVPGDDQDATAAIQAAIDSGAHTVYLPNGRWTLSGTLHLRGAVQRLIGCEAVLLGDAVISIDDGEAPVVAIERFELLPIHGPGVRIVHRSQRTAVLSNLRMRREGHAYEALDGAGNVFIQDVAGDTWSFAPGQQVWARQLNPESSEPMVVNRGADVWILGLKTENKGTALHAMAGRTEIVGAFIYANTRSEKNPLFVIDDGAEAAITFGESSFRGFPFRTLVSQTRGAETRTVAKGATPSRGEGSAMTLYRTAPLASQPR